MSSYRGRNTQLIPGPPDLPLSYPHSPRVPANAPSTHPNICLPPASAPANSKASLANSNTSLDSNTSPAHPDPPVGPVTPLTPTELLGIPTTSPEPWHTSWTHTSVSLWPA
ncbi:hypothetical protein H2248_008727 [Termitomyces sp. 'cryptogamus']|nr:hypothetical protein H2248_008727 [Termitomyces sp. 'cryptogamus']